jgi:hypothetical protein
LLSTVFARVRRVWRDKVAGPTLRTYDAACDELGGEPWRPVPEATDRWFLADRPKSLVGKSPSAPQLPTMDTASFDLRRHMSDATKIALLAGASLIAIAVVVFALTHGSAHAQTTSQAALPATATPAAAVTSPAAVVKPPVAAVTTPVAAVAPTIAPAPSIKLARASVFAKRHFAHRRRR